LRQRGPTHHGTQTVTIPKNTKKTTFDAREMFIQGLRFDYACNILSADSAGQTRVGLRAGKIKKADISKMPAGLGVPTGDIAISTFNSEDCPYSAIPLIVNRVLTAEIYLKCILRLKQITYPKDKKGHTLSEMWTLVPNDIQAVVEKRYKVEFESSSLVPARNAATDKTAFDLVNFFRMNDTTFTAIRYAYEYEDWTALTLQPATIALRCAILKLQPQWKPFAECLENGPTLLHRSKQSPIAVPHLLLPSGSQLPARPPRKR
jgi:hypothetical protein